MTLVALDQPTVVPNLTSMRPVELAAGTLLGWIGGGVQPSNRGRRGMFCDASPIWRFLAALGAAERPQESRVASDGLHLVEVFPALALPSLDAGLFGRLRAPKYNPKKKTFRVDDWVRVTEVAARAALRMDCPDLAEWCAAMARNDQPRKSDQDKLDSALCVLIALHWRLCPREASLLLGGLSAGYMVLPASQEVREYLRVPAQKHSVAMDGIVPIG